MKPEKAEPKTASAPKKAAVKHKKAASASAKPARTPKPVANTPSTSPLENISALLDSLPLEVCVQLTRRLLASISSLPKGAALPLEYRNPLRHCVWRHALAARIGAKLYALHAGMRTACAAGSLSWSTFSDSTVSIYVS